MLRGLHVTLTDEFAAPRFVDVDGVARDTDFPIHQVAARALSLMGIDHLAQ